MRGKKILFIAPNFFGYELEIKTSLERMGAVVDYFNERPKNSFLVKSLLRLHKNSLIYLIRRYYKRILKLTKTSLYDFVFVLNAEAIDSEILRKLRVQNVNAEFILYMWDSVSNKKNTHQLLPYFDKTFSFDPADAESFKNINFLPLFYCDLYGRKTSIAPEYKFSFVGTAHSDRYRIVQEIKKNLDQKKISYLFFLFLQSPLLLFYLKLRTKGFEKASLSDFSFKSLSLEDTASIILKSEIVVDISHPRQSGLTMRTIEALGANKKLVTTNQNVLSADFYHPNNILLIDKDNIQIEDGFINSSYIVPEKKIYEKYSLENWLLAIFEVQS